MEPSVTNPKSAAVARTTCDIWENWYKIFLTRNEFKGFENLVNILGISKVFVKLLEIELCFDYM